MMLLSKLSTYLALFSAGTAAFAPSLPTRATSLLYAQNGQDLIDDGGRRAFLSSSVITALVGVGYTPAAHALGKKGVDYKAVAGDIASIIKEDKNKGPTLVRLAWHSSGTYDKMSKDGGSGGGTIRFKEEFCRAGRNCCALDGRREEELLPSKNWEDLPFHGGRVDALDPSAVTPDGRLPGADSGPPGADPSDAAHLRTIFNRMGFNDQEIVALSGAHALGRCHTTASGYDGPWTPTPTMFNNLYFSLLDSVKWTPRDWKGPFQYEDEGKTLMMLPTDLVLIQDDEFKKYVSVYAKDQAKFFADFSKAFNKLEELGTKGLKSTTWA
ncbi:hypothetical protein ACHAWT_006359 [Skeletonema menzelii]